jgi:hypothetical protein
MEVVSGGVPVVEVAERYECPTRACMPGYAVTARRTFRGWLSCILSREPQANAKLVVELLDKELRKASDS